MPKRSRLDDPSFQATSGPVEVKGTTVLQLVCKNIHCRHVIAVDYATVEPGSTPVKFTCQFHVQRPDEAELATVHLEPEAERALSGGSMARLLLPVYLVRTDYVVCPQCQTEYRVQPHHLEGAFPHVAEELEGEGVRRRLLYQ
ncbi:MAG: hypothetical protein EBR07_13610, partial [Planctomycetes bacterium]|nr:hypothetical protein [Planctomycetota bacterium]